MTAGERGRDDYGHDDQSYEPYYPPASGPAEPPGAEVWQDFPTQAGIPRYDGHGLPAGGHEGENPGWPADQSGPELNGGWGVDPGYQSDASGWGQQQPGYGDPRYVAGHDDRYQDQGYQDPRYQGGYQDPRYADPGYQDPGYRDTGYQDPRYPDPRYQSAGYQDPRYQDPARWGAGPPGGPDPAWDNARPPDGPDMAAGDADLGVDRRADRRKGLPLWQELPLLLIIAFCLAVLLRTFLVQAFYIPSGSMEDTLVAGDRVLVNKLVYNFREPARGEVVVFRGTDAWAPLGDVDGDIGTFARVGRTLGDLVGISRPGEKDYIKRIIGLPGDRISCCDVNGRIYVNGQPLDEEYVIRDSQLDAPSAQDCRGRRFDEVVVESGQMFVLGDHRLVSQDSRCQGQVPIENIIGRAFVIVWPNNRWTSLPAPDTFDEVPQPAAGVAMAPADPLLAPLPLALPVLLPLPLALGSMAARSRPAGRPRSRRLAK